MFLVILLISLIAICMFGTVGGMLWLFVKYATKVAEDQEAWRKELDIWRRDLEEETGRKI